MWSIGRQSRPGLVRWIGAATSALILAAGLSAPADAEPASITLTTTSNRADLISGDNALVEAVLAPGTDPAKVHVEVDGRDVTSEFAVRPDGRFAGVVDGLGIGENKLVARGPRGAYADLTITNHPLAGPIFSGPQIQPWYCLPGAEDDQCSRPTTFSYQYKSTITGQFTSYDPENPPPDALVAATTTDQGETVPYIVRLETGTMDRSQYRIAVLATAGEEWTRWEGPAAWNHKVYVPHGAGCGMGHSEGQAPEVLLDIALRRGFAVLSTALEHNTENCNVVVQAESVMMAKEHLIESYGDIRYLFGTGCSGGSIAQLQMANAYPGLYDGLTVGCTYPDALILDLLDCTALLRYFDDPSRWAPGVVWTEAHQAAASGQASTSVCRSWVQAPGTNFARMYDPRQGVDCDIPDKEPARVYDPETNPGGVRCSFQDYLVNIFGTRPPERWGPIEQAIDAGFANRPYDNVGLQYGLRALQAGEITPAQFADLNAKIGAVDIDYGRQAARVEADPNALTAAYRSGVLNEANNLDLVPIIDMPIPGDRYEIHDNYKSWALRARLDAANGHHDNHVIWYGPGEDGMATGLPDNEQAFTFMDRWLSAIEADHRDLPREQKVVGNRPAELQDRCDLPDSDTCNALFGPAGNPRWAAGNDIRNDIIKCRLQPLRQRDYYPVQFTDEQWSKLGKAFPGGVCDWAQPGVGQQHTVAWQTYSGGPGGEPMGPPPVSSRTSRP